MTSEITPATGGPALSGSDQVAAALRARIHTGELRPGARLPTQQDLEAEFGVKRTVVRQALGILKGEGLVAMGRGAPATVSVPKAPAQPPATPAFATVLLSDRLCAAFRAEHVTVDLFSLTTETLNGALHQAIMGITTGDLQPASITVRVLLPTPGAQLALPQVISDPHDDRALKRLRRIIRTYVEALRADLEALRERGQVGRVSMEVRSVPATPLHKLYVLNSEEALFSYYPVVTRTIALGEEEQDIYDVSGIDAELFWSSSGTNARNEQEKAFVAASRSWFESLWSTIALPFTFD